MRAYYFSSRMGRELTSLKDTATGLAFCRSGSRVDVRLTADAAGMVLTGADLGSFRLSSSAANAAEFRRLAAAVARQWAAR